MVVDHDPSETSSSGPANLADWRALGYLVRVTTERLTYPVEGMHRAILQRWLGMAGTRANTGRRLADGMTASVYQAIRLGGRAVGTAISIGARLVSERATVRPLWETTRGRYVQSIFNGVWGDRFEEDGSQFRIELGLRDRDGALLPTSPASLSRAFPRPTGRLVILLHGLGETERCWQSDDSPDLSEGLEADGFSVLRVRYNTGLAVSETGSDLARVVEEIRLSWPVPVDEVALIGHSMGGLVIRSSVDAARAMGLPWVELVRHLVAIGTPHLGSPIEKGVKIVGDGLGLFNETRPLRTFLEQRSAGIKDMGGINPQFGHLDAIDDHIVAGVVTRRPSHPLGLLLGDLVVRVGSATGGGRVGASDVLIAGGRKHADLINDQEVISRIRAWLTAGS
ncbi:MAG: alpha/beta fold hydrolase [Acidimicrobiia bacterium]